MPWLLLAIAGIGYFLFRRPTQPPIQTIQPPPPPPQLPPPSPVPLPDLPIGFSPVSTVKPDISLAPNNLIVVYTPFLESQTLPGLGMRTLTTQEIISNLLARYGYRFELIDYVNVPENRIPVIRARGPGFVYGRIVAIDPNDRLPRDVQRMLRSDVHIVAVRPF